MPQKIIIVRHAETVYNVERRLQGWQDIPLTEQGIIQATKVAKRLSAEKPAAIYSSDLKRAMRTAEHIAAHHRIKPFPSQELREDHLGIFEGWQWEVETAPDKQKMWEERHRARQRGDLHFTIGGSETLHSHLARVAAFIAKLEQNHSGDTVIVVSHGGTMNRIMEHFQFKTIGGNYIHYKNTAISVIEKKRDVYKLVIDNDVSHL